MPPGFPPMPPGMSDEQVRALMQDVASARHTADLKAHGEVDDRSIAHRIETMARDQAMAGNADTSRALSNAAERVKRWGFEEAWDGVHRPLPGESRALPGESAQQFMDRYARQQLTQAQEWARSEPKREAQGLRQEADDAARRGEGVAASTLRASAVQLEEKGLAGRPPGAATQEAREGARAAERAAFRTRQDESIRRGENWVEADQAYRAGTLEAFRKAEDERKAHVEAERVAREAKEQALARGAEERALAEAALARHEAEYFKERDAELKRNRDEVREAEERIKQLKAEGRAREVKYWEDYRDSHAAAAAQYTAEAEKYDTASRYASAAQTGADLSMSIVSQYGGTTGKAISAGYTFTKTAAGALAEGESVTTAMAQGAKETILDVTAGAIQDKLHLGFKTPLQDAPAREVITRLVDGGGKAAATEGAKALANYGVGEGIKYPVTKGVELIGRNLP